ncbi:MAG TPA: outer membrane beta-barrel domain-containing protein [Polyangiaceae bacterium]|nr:outer membrane beta-barrel domain-containing protein [Polyangiaceae bacterium]
MKQARRWLLLAAALTLLAQPAYAQKKKPKGGTKGAAPTQEGAPAPAGAAPAGAAPVPVDADAEPAPAGAPPPAGADTGAAGAGAAEPGGAAEGGMDVCQITPDAPQCQAAKEFNLAVEAQKPIHAEIYAVQQQYVIKSGRFELQPYFEITLNDQFVSHDAPGLALNYYITQVLAVGLNGNWYQGLNADSDFNFQNRREARIAAPLNEYQASGDLNFTYVPMYGKFAGFGDFIFHYDAYIDGGVGFIRTRPIPVIDPDNRKFDWNTLINFDVGIGLRIFFNRWLAAVFEIRDLIFFDKIERLTIANGTGSNSATSPSTWYDPDTHFTNDVQMQIGLALFLPTSFEYRLPK